MFIAAWYIQLCQGYINVVGAVFFRTTASRCIRLVRDVACRDQATWLRDGLEGTEIISVYTRNLRVRIHIKSNVGIHLLTSKEHCRLKQTILKVKQQFNKK